MIWVMPTDSNTDLPFLFPYPHSWPSLFLSEYSHYLTNSFNITDSWTHRDKKQEDPWSFHEPETRSRILSGTRNRKAKQAEAVMEFHYPSKNMWAGNEPAQLHLVFDLSWTKGDQSLCLDGVRHHSPENSSNHLACALHSSRLRWWTLY